MSKGERRLRTDVIVRALRCTATPGGRCLGDKCPYQTTEKVPEQLREQVGRDERDSCDVDAVALDAAKRLEELTELVRRKDALLLHMSVAGHLGIDIVAAILRKVEINRGRPWKHGKEEEGR